MPRFGGGGNKTKETTQATSARIRAQSQQVQNEELSEMAEMFGFVESPAVFSKPLPPQEEMIARALVNIYTHTKLAYTCTIMRFIVDKL